MKQSNRAPIGRAGITAAGVAVGLLLSLYAHAQQQPAGQKQPEQNAQRRAAAEIRLREFEENASKYMGQRIAVTGEVQNVVGPRLFTVDEKQWVDLDGETLVVVPPPMAAFVRENAPVRVTGTVRPFVRTDIEREWGWFDPGPHLEIDLRGRPIIVADTVMIEGRSAVISMSIDRSPASSRGAVATAGTSGAGQTLTDLRMLAETTDERLVGRRVELHGGIVAATVPSGGFWLGQGDQRLFVLPAGDVDVKLGQDVHVSGVVLELPHGIRDRLGANAIARNENIYVYADRVSQMK